MIEKDALGPLTTLRQGIDGVVYRAPDLQTEFSDRMVFKRYEAVTTDVDYRALAAMTALVESLPYEEAKRLLSIAAWPCAVVGDAGGPCGFVMPQIPEQFLTTAPDTARATAKFRDL